MEAKTKDSTIKAESEGDCGSTVIFIHGLGDTSSIWSGASEGLRLAHRVIRPDLRGCGGSGRGSQAYTLELLAQDLIVLLDALQVPQCHIVGHSLGGVVAQEALTRYPDRFASAVLISTSSKVGEKASAGWQKLAASVESRGEVRNSPRATERGFSERFAAAHPDIVADKALRASKSDPAVYAAQARAASSYDYTKALGAVTVPVLVLQGDADRMTPVGGSVLLARALPNATLELLKGVGHNVPTELGKELGARIARFLAEVES